MDLEEARAFVTHINEERRRFPGFYSGHYIKQLLGTGTDPILAECWFWLAQYGPTPVVPKNWKTWTMWQYTDGALGPTPHTVRGLGRCDRDKFNGSEAQLRNLWGAPGPFDIPSASTPWLHRLVWLPDAYFDAQRSPYIL